MFKYKVGNILDTECKYILNPVNCVGTMGKGLALQIAKKYPESVEPYKKDCRHGSLSIGHLTSFNAKDGKTIINLKDELIKEYTCALTRDELFEGKISFKVDDLAEAETVLQIMYLITEKLEEMKANKKHKKEALNAN